MSEELDTVDKQEVQKCLKDANIFEEGMSEDLMIQYYKAIKNSETSLHEEKERCKQNVSEEDQSFNESAEELSQVIFDSESIAPSPNKKSDTFIVKNSDDENSLDAFAQNFIPKGNSSSPKEEESNNNNNNNNNIEDNDKNGHSDLIMDIKKTPIGFNDMPKSENVEKNMLKIVSHELKYVNIQNSKKFIASNSDTRVAMLYHYHVTMSKLRAYYASISSKYARPSKTMTATDYDLCVNPTISAIKEEEVKLQSQETYVSRSGRLTKRKVYNEADDSSQDSFVSSSKKAKGNDEEWLSKGMPKEKVQKPALKKNEPFNNNSGDKAVEKVEKNSKETDVFDDLKENNPIVAPKPRTYNRKLSYTETLSKSSLSKDFDSPKKSRTEALLNAVLEENEKKKKQEEELEKFMNSVDADSQALSQEQENIVVDDEEEEVPFQKRRVLPPVPLSRRSIHGKKRGGGIGPEPLNISSKKPNLSLSSEDAKHPTTNGIGRKHTNVKRGASNANADVRGEPSSSSAARNNRQVEMMPCPLCSVSFPQKEIEEHAATCGEDIFPQTNHQKYSRITCEVCDQVFLVSTEYEIHVKECIARQREKDQ